MLIICSSKRLLKIKLLTFSFFQHFLYRMMLCIQSDCIWKRLKIYLQMICCPIFIKMKKEIHFFLFSKNLLKFRFFEFHFQFFSNQGPSRNEDLLFNQTAAFQMKNKTYSKKRFKLSYYINECFLLLFFFNFLLIRYFNSSVD